MCVCVQKVQKMIYCCLLNPVYMCERRISLEQCQVLGSTAPFVKSLFYDNSLDSSALPHGVLWLNETVQCCTFIARKELV